MTVRTDNEILTIVIGILNTGLAGYFQVPPIVKQAYQPTQQGAEDTADAVMIHSITSKRYGYPEDESYWDSIDEQMIQRQSWWLERTYQVDAILAKPSVSSTARTAFDYIEAVSTILQTSAALATLRANDIGILRIQPLRIQYIVNDREQHDQVPSFDFTLTYKQVLLTAANELTTYDAAIYGV